MLPYIIVFFIVLSLSKRINKNKWNIYDFIILIILVCFAGFRYKIGTDYVLYEAIYKNSTNLTNAVTNRTGYGFSILCNFMVNNGIDYKLFIFICSSITVSIFYIFYKKNSENPGLSIILYMALGVYTSSFNGFRQLLSMSILLLAFMSLRKRKYVGAIIFGVISFSIHSSSIFAIIIYSILIRFNKINIDFKKIFPFFIVFFVMYNYFFAKIIGLFADYSFYLDYESTAGLGTYMIVLTYLLVYIFFINPHKNDIIDNYKDSKLFYNLITIGVCIMFIQIRSWLFARFSIYFSMFVPIVLAEYYKIRNLRNKELESFVFYCCIFVYYLVYIYSFGGVYPYKSIFLI